MSIPGRERGREPERELGPAPADGSVVSPAPAPGWYSAGVAGQERWWSGTEWTEYVRPTPYSEKWDRPGWGANPEVTVALAVLCVLMFLGFQLVVLSFLLNGDAVRGIGGFVVTLGFLALAVIAALSARIGFRRKRLGRPAAGEFPRVRPTR